jgi:uncharacterized phage protein gp47/JayE
MGVATPDNSTQVEERIKADVQREAPDSNPYLREHWLSSLIVGTGRRQFDFYRDLNRTEDRLMPDTADEETAPRWGNIFIGEQNAASGSSGNLVAQGVAGGSVGIGEVVAVNGKTYETVSSAVIADQTINVLSITRSGATATVIAAGPHNLSSFVPVTISGADQSEYNVTDAVITVTGLDSFTYQVSGTPVTPATGTIEASFTSASVPVESIDFGSDTNLDLDTPVKLQSPIVDVDDTLHVDFGAIGGGTDEESIPDYKVRYLDKIRNPIAHFNANDIKAKAKEVAGVTRVFVEEAGDEVGTIAVTSINRNGNVATVVTTAPHGYDDGQQVSITGAVETDYNVTKARIIVENTTTFHYVVLGVPSTPATGTILASASIALGQVRTFFMRDNDSDPIPTQSEVDAVEAELDTIRPANTSSADNIVKAPTANVTNYVFTELVPDTTTMRAAVTANLEQYHEEQTTVGVDDDEKLYNAAIANTVDPDTSDTIQSFTLSSPTGDLINNSGEIATFGGATFP